MTPDLLPIYIHLVILTVLVWFGVHCILRDVADIAKRLPPIDLEDDQQEKEPSA